MSDAPADGGAEPTGHAAASSARELESSLYLKFSARTAQAIVDGTKTGTIATRRVGALKKGVRFDAQVAQDEKKALIPLEVTVAYPARRLAEVPKVLAQNAMDLSRFGAAASWKDYLATIRVPKPNSPVSVVLFRRVGEPVGTPLSQFTTPTRHRSGTRRSKPWHRAQPGATVTPETQIHPEDRAQLASRLAAALTEAAPEPDTAAVLERVIATLIRSGRCAGTVTPAQQRRDEVSDEDAAAAVTWLSDHGVIVPTETGYVFAGQMLEGLRILP